MTWGAQTAIVAAVFFAFLLGFVCGKVGGE